MTQHRLAEALGVSRSLVAQWETSRGRPTLAQAEPIASALQMSEDQRLQMLRLAAAEEAA